MVSFELCAWMGCIGGMAILENIAVQMTPRGRREGPYPHFEIAALGTIVSCVPIAIYHVILIFL
jgi:hypothetical protein